MSTSAARAMDSVSIEQQLSELRQAVAAQQAQLEAQQKLLEQQAARIEQLVSEAQAKGAASTQGEAAAGEAATSEEAAAKGPARARELGAPSVAASISRPTITSADGSTSVSLRTVVQLDVAGYRDGTSGPLSTDFRRGSADDAATRENNSARDLSGGALIRRARLGLDGRLARHIDYRFSLEFGGSGTEGPARINEASIVYTGFAPLSIQLGAFSPVANMDDSTSASDLLLLERATPAELSRRLAGGNARTGLAIRSGGPRWMSAITLTSRTVGDPETFDSQLATLGRFGGLVATGSDYNVHLGLSGTYVFQPADQGSSATGVRYGFRFRDRPEVRVDGTRLIDTGELYADSAYALGTELGVNWRNYFLQAENYWYGVGRADLPTASFGGYYLQASWILTGERRRYNVVNGAFQSPRTRAPLDFGAGSWGAWEVALRYSHTDLDFREGLPGAAATPDSVRGGQQNIWTLGLNWYPSASVRLMLNYLRISVDRLNPAGPADLTPFGPAPATPPVGVQIGQDLDVIALRSQYSF